MDRSSTTLARTELKPWKGPGTRLVLTGQSAAAAITPRSANPAIANFRKALAREPAADETSLDAATAAAFGPAQSAPLATVSAMRAPRSPMGSGRPVVVSRAVWCSSSALSSAPARTM